MIALEKKLFRIRENPIQTVKQTSKKKEKERKTDSVLPTKP